MESWPGVAEAAAVGSWPATMNSEETLLEVWGPWPSQDSWVPAWPSGPSGMKDECAAPPDPEGEHLQADLSEDCESDWAAAIRAALPEPEGGFPSQAFSYYSQTACPDSGRSQEEYLARLEKRLDSLHRVPKRTAIPWRAMVLALAGLIDGSSVLPEEPSTTEAQCS
mmetsp:Transcript_23651/g.55761  ORF Transcript_23651/g.55761 Transcript_23651/m.55761 type:complete len:167 (-) Transcript_23651:248-748(-)